MTGSRHPDPFDDDRRFGDELRRALRREAAGPAPDRLVARIAASRREAPAADTRSLASRRAPSLRSWGAAFGTLAAAALIVAALALRPSGGPTPNVGGPTTSAPPSGGPATVAPATSSAASSAPASPGPATIGPVPADFHPVSVTFVSTDAGWLLGNGPCGSNTNATGTSGASGASAAASCAAVARTADGGRTWTLIPAPPTSLAQAADANAGVSGIRFADPLDGWAFGPELWATHDGGATWRRVAFPTAGATVMALETSAGAVHAAFFDSADGGTVRIASSPVGSDAWSVSGLHVQLGAGPVPQPQIVLHGAVGWLVEVDRTVVDGARLAGGQWSSWTPPCRTSNGPASLAAASETSLVAACNLGVWSTPTGVHVYASSDGGASFRAVGARLPVADLQGIAAAPASTTVVIAGRIGGGTAIVASFDGGTSWTTVLPGIAGASISNLGFTSADQGVAIATHEGGVSELLMTRDGGRTWQTVGLGS